MDATMLSPELNQRYEQQRQSIPAEVEGYYLQTPLGPVWTMEAGRKDAPPLIALHGLHTPAPFNLELFWPLTEHFRVISPDIPGQAGKTPGIAPLPSHHAYALWLEQVMDSLEISSCPMVGLSFGGAVLLDLAALKPQRISAATLIVPAGFFRPLWRPLTKLVLPLVSFKLNSDQTHFDSLMKPLMGDNWPELEAYYFATFQAGIPMTLMPPGPYHLENLVDFNAPVQMFTASEDVYFAPDKLAEKARLALGSLKEVHEIQDFHIPSSENRQFIQRECVRFLCSKST